MRRNDIGDINYASKREVRLSVETVLYDIVRNWWILAAGLVLAAMFSYVFVTETYDDEYSSTATFVVSSKGSTSTTVFSNLNTARSLAEGFGPLLVSDALMDRVMEVVGISEFTGTISSALIPDTNLLTLTVTADSPKLAFDVINAVIENHNVVSDIIMKNASIQLLEQPQVAKAPVEAMNRGANVRKYTLIAFLGIAACIAVYSVFSDVVRSEDNFNDNVEPDKIATIYRERGRRTLKKSTKNRRRRGERNIVPLVSNPTTSFGFTETYRLLRMRIGYIMKKHGYKAMLVTSVLEREGKSTAALNLAIMFATDGKRVLLMEANMLKPSLETMIGCSVERDCSIEEFIMFPKSFVRFPTMPGYSNVSLLLCKRPLSSSTELLSSAQMADFIKYAKTHFDYIIIDAPALSVSSDAECAAELADAAIIVARQGMATAKSINDAADAMEQSGADVIGCVFNDVRNTNIADMLGLFRGGNSNGYGYGYNYGYGRYDRYGSSRTYASQTGRESE